MMGGTSTFGAVSVSMQKDLELGLSYTYHTKPKEGLALLNY